MPATHTRIDQPTPADIAHGYTFGEAGFLTKKQVAKFLACSVRKVEELLAGGKLRKRKDGPHMKAPVRVCRRSVLEYARAGEY